MPLTARVPRCSALGSAPCHNCRHGDVGAEVGVWSLLPHLVQRQVVGRVSAPYSLHRDLSWRQHGRRHNDEGVAILLPLAAPVPRHSASDGACYLNCQEGQVGDGEGGGSLILLLIFPDAHRPPMRGRAEGCHDPVPPSVARCPCQPLHLDPAALPQACQGEVALSCNPSPLLHRRSSLPGSWGGSGIGRGSRLGAAERVSSSCYPSLQSATPARLAAQATCHARRDVEISAGSIAQVACSVCGAREKLLLEPGALHISCGLSNVCVA